MFVALMVPCCGNAHQTLLHSRRSVFLPMWKQIQSSGISYSAACSIATWQRDVSGFYLAEGSSNAGMSTFWFPEFASENKPCNSFLDSHNRSRLICWERLKETLFKLKHRTRSVRTFYEYNTCYCKVSASSPLLMGISVRTTSHPPCLTLSEPWHNRIFTIKAPELTAYDNRRNIHRD